MIQKEYIGIGMIYHLGDILDNLHISKAFLICGKSSFIECGAEAHINKIKNVQFVQFNDYENNPKIENVNNGIRSFQQSKAEIIIALGGGSAIDIAKLIRHFSEQGLDKVSISDITNMNNSKKRILLVAIPTTAGSGSEATSFAVMYADKVKYSVADSSILPDIVIIDPLLSMTLSSQNTAVTGMDALCHAIESYWSINSTNESKNYAKEAMTIILNNLHETVHNPTVELRSNMAKAANLSGKAINISKTTAAHAISYTFTSYFAIPHGLAVSFFIPDLLVYNYNVSEHDADDPRGVDYIKQTINEINHFFGGNDCYDTKIILEKFINNLGLSRDLSFYGIKYNDIDFILNNINNERLKNNPRRLNLNNLREIIELRY
jgi:alcohol dehydrogenase class IV